MSTVSNVRSMRPATADDLRNEWEATFRIDAKVAEARHEMGETRWAELNAEWEASAAPVHGWNAAKLWAGGHR